MKNKVARLLGPCIALVLCTASFSARQSPLLGASKVSQTTGGLVPVLPNNAAFGLSMAGLGDLDGDGVPDLAVGDAVAEGALNVLFLNADGSVRAQQRIDATQGGLLGPLRPGDQFGHALANLGDLNGDGVTDLAVGAPGDADGGSNRGAVWILFLSTDGTVNAQWKISDISGGLQEPLINDAFFGTGLACPGDIDNDGVRDLVVVCQRTLTSAGAAIVLFLRNNGTVRSEARVEHSVSLVSAAALGDLNRDGVEDIALGSPVGADGKGQVFIDFLDSLGHLSATSIVSASTGYFYGDLRVGDQFGFALTSIGDIDGDLVPEILVGAPGAEEDSTFNPDRGESWILYLRTDGTVKQSRSFGDSTNSIFNLDNFDTLGSGVASLGDLNGDSMPDLAVGLPGDDDGGSNRGAAWILMLDCLASTTDRNGSNVNPATLASITAPILGALWTVDMNCIGHSPSVARLLVFQRPTNGVFVSYGELLVAGARLASFTAPHVGGVVRFTLPVPLDAALCGLTASSQGLCFGAPAPVLTNAVDLMLGH